jgi:hypothetical protein
MNYFLNYSNGGQVKINTYCNPRALLTDVEDIRNAVANSTDETLTASVEGWIAESVKQDGDLLELVFEGEFGLSLASYPALRDIQRDAREQLQDSL